MGVKLGDKTIRAVLFDWAGTTVDHGSLAPVRAFSAAFTTLGVPITDAEARGPMGRAKRDHIAQILAVPRVTAAWRTRHGRDPAEADVDALYQRFLPLQKEVLAQHCDVIAGVPEVVEWLRRQGVRIGSSTGYTFELMQVVLPLAKAGGYDPEVMVCTDDVPEGRPAPWLNFLAAQRLGVYPLSEVLVVDDTPVGIAAGRNAGAITVAIARTGNAMGLSVADLQALPVDDLNRHLRQIHEAFYAAGAHYVLDSVADLRGWLS
ncbi:MAG TPA: phosphonoacetaldehyde hydrolase [Planctomycetaceae bacterium]|jgi:phosphonoacetaldehyde hydrolase|nr:phosphonoacetaldehyde hydrolase [Planctomycetaceae bacterium]